MLHKIIKSSLISFLSVLLSKLFVFLVNVLVSRSSSPSEYGVFVLLRSMVNFFDTILSSSVSPVVLVKCSKSPENISSNKRLISPIIQSVVIVFLFSLAISLVLVFIGANGFNLLYLPDVELFQLEIVLCLFFAMYVNGVVTSIYLAKKRFLFLFNFSLLSGVISIVLFSVLKRYEVDSVLSGLFSLLFFQFLDLFLKITFSKVDLEIVFNSLCINSAVIADLKNKIIFFMPLVLASLINSVVFFFSRVWLSNNSNGLTELALFDVSFQFLIIQMLFLNTVTNVVIGYSKNFRNENYQLMVSIGLGLVFSFVSWSFIYIYKNELVSIFGEEYSSNVLPILTSASVFYAVAIAFNRKYVGSDLRKILSVVSILSSASMVVFIMNSEASALNLSFGYVLYYFSSVLVYVWFYFKRSVLLVK